MHLRAGVKGQRGGRPETSAFWPLASPNLAISARHTWRAETTLTHSNQTVGAHSTRHKTTRSRTLLHRRLLVAFLRTPVCAALAILLGATAALAHPRPAKTLTVERIYGAPNLSGSLTEGIEWEPDGRRISYLDHTPETEMWTMDAATGRRSVLVNADVLNQVTQPQRSESRSVNGARPRPSRNLLLVAKKRCTALFRQQQPRSSESENDGGQATRESLGRRGPRNRGSQIFSRWPMG